MLPPQKKGKIPPFIREVPRGPFFPGEITPTIPRGVKKLLIHRGVFLRLKRARVFLSAEEFFLNTVGVPQKVLNFPEKFLPKTQ